MVLRSKARAQGVEEQDLNVGLVGEMGGGEGGVIVVVILELFFG